MGRLTLTGVVECEVGGVHHICYFTPPEMKEIIDKKGKENLPTNGNVFPYIAHYLTTGDVIYPAHEGERPVSSLLEELSRLDLVRKLFPNQTGSKASHNTEALRSPGKSVSGSDSSTPLRIRTKNERWMSKALSRLPWLHKADTAKQHQVYRPPTQQNKGTTLVLVKSCIQGTSQLRVHGPSAALQSLMPGDQTITTLPTHHHLNSHLVPSASSADTVVMNLEEQGFVVTVRSSFVEGKSGALITQWLLYRGSSKKLMSLSGTASRRTASLGKALTTSKKNLHCHSTSRKKPKRRSPFSSDRLDSSSSEEVHASNPNSAILRDDTSAKDLGRRNLDSQSTASSSSSSSPSSSSSRSGSSPPSKLPSPLSSSTSFSHLPQRQPPKRGFPKPTATKSFSEKAFPPERVMDMHKLSLSPSPLHPLSPFPPTSKPLPPLPPQEHKGLSQKCFSSDSIANRPASKLKHSPSLWDICSNRPAVKKVFTILF